MKWTQEEPKPVKRPDDVIESNGVRISINDTKGGSGRQWCYVAIRTGQLSELSREELRRSWPKLAIAILRDRINEFEKQLEAMEGE